MRGWLLLALLVTACAGDPCLDGGMVGGDAGLVVTASEHGEGWGRGDCAGCHALPNLHRFSCTEDIDMAALREEIEAVGAETCGDCHGDNGVAP